MNELQVVKRPGIKVMKFERSDVLRQRRLKKQLREKELHDELLFRRIMTCSMMAAFAVIGFVAGEIVAASILL